MNLEKDRVGLARTARSLYQYLAVTRIERFRVATTELDADRGRVCERDYSCCPPST